MGMSQNLFNQVKMQIPFVTTIVQTQNNVPTYVTKNQSVTFYVDYKRNVFQTGCFSDVAVTMHGDFVQISGVAGSPAPACDPRLIAAQGYAYDDVQFMLIVSENRDYSGLTYSRLFPVPGYALGRPLRHALRCGSGAECAAFRRAAQLQAARGNVSVVLETAFLRGGAVVLRSQHVPAVRLPAHARLRMAVGRRRVCVRVDVAGPQVVDVAVAVGAVELGLSFFAAGDEGLFCQRADARLRAATRALMRGLAGNAPAARDARALVNQQEVGEVDVHVYSAPEDDGRLAWAALGAALALWAALVAGTRKMELQ